MRAKLIRVLLLTLPGLFLFSGAAWAHPLGNYSVNQHVGVDVTEDSLQITYILDMAEVPAFQEMELVDSDADGKVSDAEAVAYASELCEKSLANLDLINGGMDRVAFENLKSGLTFPPGQAGLSTLRLECEAKAPGSGAFVISNNNFPGRLGWSEIVISGMVSSDLPAASPSNLLTAYPPDQPLLDIRSARFETDPGAGIGIEQEAVAANPPVGAVPGLVAGAFDSESGSVTLLISLLGAFILGVGHAAAPGHGKTLMGAYIVGSRGTWRQASVLGLTVAVTHTVGVAVLGLLTVAASAAFQPELIYPYLSAAAGVAVLGVGIGLAARIWRNYRFSSHSHDHSNHNHPHLHEHGSGGHGHHHNQEHGEDLLVEHPRISTGSLAALGLSGGLVPSASAVVLFLGAVSVGRPIIGVTMVLLFGIGMAVTLVAAGVIVVYTQQKGRQIFSGKGRLSNAWAALTPMAALVVIGFGGVMTTTSIAQIFSG